MLIDAQGRRLGYDPVSGQDVNEFFDKEANLSNYFRYAGTEGNYSNAITLAPLEAWGSTITITVTGFEPGEYALRATFSDGYTDFFLCWLILTQLNPVKFRRGQWTFPKPWLNFPIHRKYRPALIYQRTSVNRSRLLVRSTMSTLVILTKLPGTLVMAILPAIPSSLTISIPPLVSTLSR